MILLVFVTIIISYLVLIGSLAFGFEKVKSFTLEDVEAKTGFSVIIPFRNEAENLPELLASIETLQYPKHLFEIILVDDASEDASVAIIKDYISTKKTASASSNIRIIKNIRNSLSPKKDAITSAIQVANHNWIVTTDADCVLPKFWLDSFDAFIQKTETHFIVAPVTYSKVNSFLKRFQLLDILSLQGATIGGFGIQKPFLCNGANLAYKKDLFNTVKGFKGNTNIASGDDIFLLEKALKQDAKKVHYLKCQHTIVTTEAEKTISNLIAQRVRWASKSTNYKNSFAKVVGLLVLLTNASIICALILSITGIINFNFFIYLFLIKCSIDFLLVFKTVRFYKQEAFLSSFLFSCILYPFFSIYVVFVSVFTNYKWKGRAFKK
ncbi:glycosyltransferase [Lacinutrix sp. C3R15]|uniref:glycosyltransferase family 2 protein n=1 Tax=Flavobacteriaceae TaxID=49546 RepID=UPI001C0869C0|nr:MULTISPECIES: glycosyltransferase [Flavobacteriaceae]MBU2939085.1 glycosyltransferase [Lacinutrix sp. C3R15]MDO6622400.1 glycosyltransferase [Oceanihabitans sp. 1_MG-2023]